MRCCVKCRRQQCVTVCCSVLQCVAVRYIALQCVSVCYSALQCIAACCSVLQRVAACCSVLCIRYLAKCRSVIVHLKNVRRCRILRHTSFWRCFDGPMRHKKSRMISAGNSPKVSSKPHWPYKMTTELTFMNCKTLQHTLQDTATHTARHSKTQQDTARHCKTHCNTLITWSHS